MEKAKNFIIARLQETSTWTGLGFFIAMCGGTWALGLDWQEGVGLGVLIAKTMSTFMPDKVKAENDIPNP